MTKKEKPIPLFPFYTYGANDVAMFASSFTGKIFTKYFESYAEKGDANRDCIDIDITSDICSQYTKELEDILTSESIKNLQERLSDGLECIDEEVPDEFICVKRNFLCIKESVLNGVEPSNESISQLYKTLKSDTLLECHLYLLKYFGLNIEKIKSYFQKINSFRDNFTLRQCFCSIGITGLRVLTNEIIVLNFTSDLDRPTLLSFRHYCELHALYIMHINDTLDTPDASNPEVMIHQLLRTAFYEGQIFREGQFYTEKSLAVMLTVGGSHKCRHATKPKKELYEQAVNRCLKKINDPQRKKNRARIIEEIAGSAEFKEKNLSTRKIADMIRTTINEQINETNAFTK